MFFLFSRLFKRTFFYFCINFVAPFYAFHFLARVRGNEEEEKEGESDGDKEGGDGEVNRKKRRRRRRRKRQRIRSCQQLRACMRIKRRVDEGEEEVSS